MGKDSSKLLIDEHPLQVLPTLACKIGLNGAIVLQQIHYWLVISKKAKDERKFKDGRWWVYNSYDEWQENFPWWSLPTIKRTIYRLEEAGLLLSTKMNAPDWDHTKWYSINYEALDDLTDCIKMIRSKDSEWDDRGDQNDTILKESETSTETTTEREEVPVVFSLYENNIGMITPLIADALNAAVREYSEQWVTDVIEIAVQNNARRWNYCAAILERWKREGRDEKLPHKGNGKNKIEADRDRYLKGEYAQFVEH